MKSEWNRVTWYSKLITAGLFAGLYMFGVYVGQQYTEAMQPSPAIVYTAYKSKEVSVLLAPIVFTVTSAETMIHKIVTSTTTSHADVAKTVSTPAKTTSTSATSTTSTPPIVIAAPAVVVPPMVPVVTAPVITPPVVVTPPPVVPTPTTNVSNPPPAQSSNEISFTAYTTGYGWPDNTPPSAEISNPVIHTIAGGTGTYADPITVAVGHTISGNNDTLDYPEGTKFYIPNLRRYFIVEDTCGDGNSPQNGPCHTGYQGHVWLDLWVGGTNATKSGTLACEDTVTDLHLVIQNPAANYAVVSGPVYSNSCSAQFGDTVVTS